VVRQVDSVTTLIEFARLFWQVTHEVPRFYLNRMDQLTKRLHDRDTLTATVGKDDAVVWLSTMGGDAEAAVNLVQAGYTIEQVMKIKEGLRS
jgi:hypothetical protein